MWLRGSKVDENAAGILRRIVMRTRLTQIPFLFSILLIATTVAAGQTTTNSPATGASSDEVAKQIGMLRTSVQSLDATLNDIADKLDPRIHKGEGRRGRIDGANLQQLYSADPGRAAR